MEDHEAKRGYRQLIVWQRADELAYEVYKVTRIFPDDERFGLTSQMRRASVSIAANLVEGHAHTSNRARRRFYEIARSSLVELEFYIDFTHRRLRYLSVEQYERLSGMRHAVGRLLTGLIRSMR